MAGSSRSLFQCPLKEMLAGPSSVTGSGLQVPLVSLTPPVILTDCATTSLPASAQPARCRGLTFLEVSFDHGAPFGELFPYFGKQPDFFLPHELLPLY